MTPTHIPNEKIEKVAKEWSNLTFKVWAADDKKRLYVKKRESAWGYIDLINNTICPNPTGVSRRTELTSILNLLVN